MMVSFFNNISFAMPQFFGLMLLLPLLAWWQLKTQHRTHAAFKVSSIHAFDGIGSWLQLSRHLPLLLRIMALACIIVALARPQTKTEEQQAEGEGIDIVLCIDVSGSMTAQDFSPNRMEAAKKVAIDFVQRRATDRIGVVIFSGESFTQCPLTTDKAVLRSAIENIHNGLLADGTSIGDGLGTSVDRLRTAAGKSRVVVLLTDGENNGGLIGPDNAKEIAKAFGIKVYTIGVGADGYANFPVMTPGGVVMEQQKVSIDEKLLTQIATETGGQYFRAKDTEGLQQIYNSIDKLEKRKIQLTSFTRYTEKFLPFLMAAIVLLLVEWILRFTWLKKFP
jgi:Ca-activated chloride channel homolog